MKKILLFMLVLLANVGLFAQTADEIITASRKAMNLDAFKNINTLIIAGSQFMPAAGQDIEMTYKLKKPDKVYVEMKVMGMDIIQATNGKKAWTINPMSGSKSPQSLPDEANEQFLQVFEYLESPIGKYGEDDGKYEFVSTETIEDVTYNKVKLTDKDGDEHYLYFDAVTNWFYKMQTPVVAEGGEKKVVDIIYEDKTKVKGVILPQVIEIKVDGETVQVMRFDEYEANVEIDDKVFEKP